jgi:hypothetical protein
MGAFSEWMAHLRQPARAVRVALALWVVWALVVWNVVFDRVVVLAGRRFVYEAAVTSSAGEGYLSAGAWMRSATQRGLMIATASAAFIVAVGGILVRLAARRASPERPTAAAPTPEASTNGGAFDRR